ncbi:MAG: hypothetical protein QOF30_633, partial [Acidimicrobiaceae bacterium]|nr:hypothetical protein [Acidimicrobiaceae bacterium]
MSGPLTLAWSPKLPIDRVIDAPRAHVRSTLMATYRRVGWTARIRGRGHNLACVTDLKVPPRLTWDQVLVWRMKRQWLSETTAGSAVDVVRRLAGVQAQVPSAAVAAVAA